MNLSSLGDSIPHVSGLDVFFPLAVVAIAAIAHPLGSARGFNLAYQPYIRLGPLTCLFDTALFLRVALHDGLQNAVQQQLSEMHYSETLSYWGVMRPWRLMLLDLRIRVIMLVVVAEQYAKMWGFTGIPISLTLVTLYFVSFAVMEGALIAMPLIGKVNTWSAIGLESKRQTSSRGGYHLTPQPKVGRGAFANIGLTILVLQAIYFLASMIYIISTSKYCIEKSDTTFATELSEKHVNNSISSKPELICRSFPPFVHSYFDFAVLVTNRALELDQYLFSLAFNNKTIYRFYIFLFGKGKVGISWFWKLPLAIIYSASVVIPYYLFSSFAGMIISMYSSTILPLFAMAPIGLLSLLIYMSTKVLEKIATRYLLLDKVVTFWIVLIHVVYYFWMWDKEGTGRREWGKYLP